MRESCWLELDIILYALFHHDTCPKTMSLCLPTIGQLPHPSKHIKYKNPPFILLSILFLNTELLLNYYNKVCFCSKLLLSSKFLLNLCRRFILYTAINKNISTNFNIGYFFLAKEGKIVYLYKISSFPLEYFGITFLSVDIGILANLKLCICTMK